MLDNTQVRKHMLMQFEDTNIRWQSRPITSRRLGMQTHLQSCMTLYRHTRGECLEDRRAHLNSAGRHMAEEGEIAKDIKGHGRAPHRALTRQLPLPSVYRPAMTTH